MCLVYGNNEKTRMSVCSVLSTKLSFMTISNFQETRNPLSGVQVIGGFTRVIGIFYAFLSRIYKTYTVRLDFYYITLNIVLGSPKNIHCKIQFIC